MISAKTNRFDSGFTKDVLAKSIIEYVSNSLLMKEFDDKGNLIVPYQTSLSGHIRAMRKKDGGCKACFANRDGDYRCHLLHTGEKGYWKD